jgi:hypothetical protein
MSNRAGDSKTKSCARRRGFYFAAFMFNRDDFEYALESTRVVREPSQLIETFGVTTFRFFLVTEFMDDAGRVRVRDGQIDAERPKIVSPHHYRKLLLDGFGEEAREYADWIEANAEGSKILRYGFQFRKSNVSEEIIHAGKDEVLGRLTADLDIRGDTMAALIEGVDDAWEVCLLKFTMDLIQRSADENVSEWKRRGLL